MRLGLVHLARLQPYDLIFEFPDSTAKSKEFPLPNPSYRGAVREACDKSFAIPTIGNMNRYAPIVPLNLITPSRLKLDDGAIVFGAGCVFIRYIFAIQQVS